MGKNLRLSGYSSREYAASLSEFGDPQKLSHCGGWILARDIPNSPHKDAMGCYPLFSCKDWSRINLDIKALNDELVSLVLVTDPFGDFNPQKLANIFDLCFFFKDHYVTDLSLPIEKSIRKRSRKYALKALRMLTVEHCLQPEPYLDEWLDLYGHLRNRHKISGINTFSEESFRLLMKTPGVELFVARKNQEIVGIDIWLISGEYGYAHLSAISPRGYEMRASYALYYFAIQHYSDHLHWLDHGGASGIHKTDDGLTMFKRGWASGTKPVYCCGKVLNRKKYDEICAKKQIPETVYFPAYRVGEFV